MTHDNGDGGHLQGRLGADTFDIGMLVGDTSADTSHGSDAQISDFPKSEDVLNLIKDAPTDDGFVFDDISIVEPEEDMPLDAAREIRVAFRANAEGTQPIVSVIHLAGITKLSLDDIVITIR